MPATAPHLRPALADAVGAALVAEAGGSARVRYRPEPKELLTAVHAHRVGTLLAQQGSAIGLPEEVVASLQAHVRAVALSSLRNAKATLSVNDALIEADVDALVFKGVALSLQTTSAISSRLSSDIDVLVRPSDMPRAHQALSANGFTPSMRVYPTDSAAWRHARWVTRELPYARADVMVDLHWRVAPAHGLFPDTDTLLSRAASVPLGGQQIRTLSPGDACAAACLSAYIDGYNLLRHFVDLHRLLRLDPRPWPDWRPRLRRLQADTLGFAEELLPHWPAQARTQLGLQGIRPRTDYAWQRWNCTAGREITEFAELSPLEYGMHYHRMMRYAARRASVTGQFMSGLVLSWQDVDPQMGARGFGHASAVKLSRIRARLSR